MNIYKKISMYCLYNFYSKFILIDAQNLVKVVNNNK